MKPQTPEMDGLRPWLDAVTAAYADVIEEIRLAGSRSAGTHRPDSDWDVLLLLRDDIYYAGEQGGVDREQAIAADESLPWPDEGVDLLILRPSGRLVRWEPVPEAELDADGTFMGTWPVISGFAEGPSCDFSRFWREWPDPPVIWPEMDAR